MQKHCRLLIFRAFEKEIKFKLSIYRYNENMIIPVQLYKIQGNSTKTNSIKLVFVEILILI